MYENESYVTSTKNGLYDRLLNSIDLQFGVSVQDGHIIPWAESLLLDGRPFSLVNHEYQQDMLTENFPRQVFMKGAQVGVTSVCMIKTLHGLISGKFPQGALYLFPTRADVLDFSRGRFNPLIRDNHQLSRYVEDTDTITIKRVAKAVLYLRGARSTARIQGMKRTSSQLLSVPVDSCTMDESDMMETAMIDLALERMSHSIIKREIYLSTPSIPGFGVDALFQKSDQRYWFIKCSKCGGETCLELEFPGCLEELSDGRVIRLCQRCRDQEIHPRDGHWTPLYPNLAKDMTGWRISQLNSMFVDPGKILQLFLNPPHGNLTEVYNSKLAQAHITAENRLTVSQILKLCDPDKPIKAEDQGPCYLGCDVGSLLHVVIGKPCVDKGGEIVYIGTLKHFSDLDDLMQKFNIVKGVIDALPENFLAREFANRHRGKIFLCYYQQHQKGSYKWNEHELTVVVNRTEALDASHAELAQGKVTLPQESETIHEFARQCSNVARVLQTDPETGSSRYVYIKTGLDHFRHGQSYECIARQNAPNYLFPEYA